jgi:cytochrome c oxidase subunit 2
VRRGSIFQLVGLGVVFGVGAAAVALLVPWLPDPASKQADRIDFLFWFVTVICIAIFALVAAVIVYAVLKFRVGPDDDSDGPPVHGHTGLEIVWTAVPAMLVTAISILSAVILTQNERVPRASAGAARDPLRPLVVDVVAQQFAWLFKYPGYNNATSSTLRLPVNKTVKLRLTSLDVIHSFWVPEFSQKQDAVPGLITRLVITPKRLGTYPVICTEVMTTSKFRQWAASQNQGAAGGGAAGGPSGKALFVSNGCDGCHTFKPAGSTGTVGPDLDQLRTEAARANKPLEAFIRESIVDPDAYVAPRYPKGVMPKTFSALPSAQIAALVKFLTEGQQ